MALFHPRADRRPAGRGDMLIPVAEGVVVGARFHPLEPSAPNILFFHGNGEIASDYDELGPIFNRIGVNLLVADYRGYGKSTGSPTVTAIMQDSHAIFTFICRWLAEKGFKGPLLLMGRSLGSAPALELAAHYSRQVAGLVIESGFAYAGPLLTLLGVDLDGVGFNEESGFRNIEKIAGFTKPVLIIHAEADQIIPFSDAQALFAASGSNRKTLVKIPGAGHNDIFFRGMTPYLAAIRNIIDLGVT